MKIPRSFNIDIEIAEELKNVENASKLVNNFLGNYLFGGNHLEEEKVKEELKKEKETIENSEKRKVILLERLKELNKISKKKIKNVGKIEIERLKLIMNGSIHLGSSYNCYFKFRSRWSVRQEVA